MEKKISKGELKVIEAKFMWYNKNGELKYIEKEKFDRLIGVAEKVVDCGIRVAVFSGISVIVGGPIYAAGTNPIMEGLQPLINLIANLSEPVTYGYMTKGFLKYTQGKEEEAKNILKYAVIGFIGVKAVPQAMEWLREFNLFA